MNRVPPIGRPGRMLHPFLVALALAASAVSCGQRTSPTAPSGTPDAVGGLPAGYVETSDAGYLDEVAVMPRAGVNVYHLARDYGATVAPNSNYVCVRFIPGEGESPDHLAARLATDTRVLAAERNAVIETAEARQESYASDDGFGSLRTTLSQPAAEALDLDDAHHISQGDRVTIAILDTGVDPQHRFLRNRIVGGVDEVDYDDDFSDVMTGRDSDGDGRADEAYGHGTHVAGIAALTAPRADLLIVRVLDSDGRGDIAGVAAGLKWAIDGGANVVNMSLGMLHPSVCIEKLLEIADARGVVVVASAGNAGAEQPIEYPAASERAIAVAASDAYSVPANFTSFGRHVDVSAPGVDVRSTYPGNRWRVWSGTSMSAPFVAGTVALLRSVHPEWTRAQIVSRIGENSRALMRVRTEQRGKLGAGMLQAGGALDPDRPGRAVGLVRR